VARDWLLITVSTPPRGTSTLRVYAWRNLRSLGAHYLQQSVCLVPATPKTTRAAARLVTRLRAEGGHGEMLRIRMTDAKQEAELEEFEAHLARHEKSLAAIRDRDYFGAPGVTRPPRLSHRARRHSPGSKARLCPRSSTRDPPGRPLRLRAARRDNA
jgi:hypothetical protein